MNELLSASRQGWARHPAVVRIGRYIDLDRSDLDDLYRLIEGQTTIKKRKELIIDGDRYRKLCFVEDGFAVRYKLLRNGKRQIINVVMPGDVVGIPSSFLERAAWSVTAVTDLKFQVCSIEDFVGLCYRRPQFGLVLTWLAVQELAILSEHITNTGRRTPLERLAHFLLEMHIRLALVGRAGEASFDLPFSQEVIGDALGLSVPHLNRMLAKLRADRLLAVDGRRIVFADVSALEVLGHFQPMKLARIPVPHNFG